MKQHAQQFASETQVSALTGTVLSKDPGFIYSAKLYALRNMQSRHYRQLILDGYQRQGYLISTLDREPTAAEKQINQKQKELVEKQNTRDAVQIATAPMPTEGQENIPAASRQKAETVRIFGVDPADLTAHHIQNHDKALNALRNRFLYRDPAAASFHRCQRIEQRAPGGDLSKVDHFDAYLLSERTNRLGWIHDLLQRADATDLFSRTDWFDHNDPMVQRIHRMVMEDPQARRHIGSRFSDFKSPIRTVQAILQVFGLKTESKMGPRSANRLRQHRINDAFAEFNPERVLTRWKAMPELLLRDPSEEAGGTQYL